MNHQDHVKLIKNGITEGGVWADLGSGRGAFTLALAECLGTESHIYSVDTDSRALKIQETRLEVEYPDNKVTFVRGDFSHKLDLPQLDGILMANSLHFVREKLPVVTLLRSYLAHWGRLVMVEYNTAEGNYAVPYPVTFEMWSKLAKEAGFAKTDLIATRPSSFLGQFFSAVSYK